MPDVLDRKKPDKIGIALRVALFALIGYLGLYIFAFILTVVLPENALVVEAALAPFAAAAIANAITVRIYERGRLSDLGLGWTRTSAREFFVGAGIAAAAAIAIILVPMAEGYVRFEAAPSVEHRLPSILFIAFVLLFGAFGEELMFHGYAFQLLVRRMGAFATILPVAVLFGFAHRDNFNANPLGIVNTMLWGVLLGYAFVRTHALWLPIGLHYGWNVALPLLGANLSGFTMGVTGYALKWRAGDLWSGGGYGPEGGLLTTIIVVVLFVVVIKLFAEPEEMEPR
ncbi:MAG TPA: type II CAAX endopeptidase family protein [Bryobacteraceae bacterium]|nr:type II CAAX endopeptidase family protein [Bryobacteraceae bacterium]